MPTKTKKPTKKFLLEVLRYGLSKDYFDMVDSKNVVVRYNGGESWNCRYVGDWHDVYLPVKLPAHKILDKQTMKSDDIEICSWTRLDCVVENMKDAIGKHFKIYDIDVSIGDNKLYLNMAVNSLGSW